MIFSIHCEAICNIYGVEVYVSCASQVAFVPKTMMSEEVYVVI